MPIPFKSFVNLMVNRLDLTRPEIKRYLNLKPHAMVLSSKYLKELGLDSGQIQEIHTLAQNKARYNKGKLKNIPGWNPETETLLLIGGKNLDRARGISNRINSMIGKGEVRTSTIATEIDKIEKDYKNKLNNFTKRINNTTKDHGIDIEASLNTVYNAKEISGQLILVVSPNKVSFNKELDSIIINGLNQAAEEIGELSDIENPITNILVNSFLGKPVKQIKKAKKGKKSIRGRADRTTRSELPPIPRRARIDLASLKNILNISLHDAVQNNMKDASAPSSKSYLRYQTGRFAKSARVRELTLSRKEVINIKYTYMRYPYDTFAPGGRQFSHGRNPKRIITQSIRDIIKQVYNEEFKTRSTLV